MNTRQHKRVQISEQLEHNEMEAEAAKAQDAYAQKQVQVPCLYNSCALLVRQLHLACSLVCMAAAPC